MKIILNYVDVSIEGDYYQICFDAKKDDGSGVISDDPYYMIQRQFEMPDGGKVYIESHDKNYMGHYRVSSATLEKNKICLELKRPINSTIEVTFKATEKVMRELRHALKTMIPSINIS